MPRANKVLPNQTYLRECFDYDQETGSLTWRERPLSHFKGLREQMSINTQYAGRIAGCVMFTGNKYYRTVGISINPFLEHRVIFKWRTGKDPLYIDHKNGNGLDNRWANLREATHSQNNANRRQKENRYLKGVSRVDSKWMAQIMRHGKRTYLGRFETQESAHAAYCKAAEELHGSFANAG